MLPLFRVALEGLPITWVRITPFGFYASVAPSGAADAFSRGPLWIPFVALVVILAFLFFLGRKQRMLGGLLIAMFAEFFLATWFFIPEIGREPHGLDRLLVPVIVLAILLWGVRWIVRGWGGATYFERVLHVTSSFVFLPSLIFSIFEWPYSSGWEPLHIISLAAGFVILAGVNFLAVLVAALPIRASLAPIRQAGWKLATTGLLLTVTIPIGTLRVMYTRERARSRSWKQAIAAFPAADPFAPYPKAFFQKGVSFAAEGRGGYESESAVQMLEQLPRFGVNAVALIPYGFERRGTTDIGIGGSMETDEGLAGLARVAHARGMKVMLKPGMWTDGEGFTGDLDFPDPAARANWFASYQRLVEHYAGLATRMHADVFCIGGEFVKLSRYDADWRRLIARARELYPGPITYGANFGEEFETLTFWDALDYIGLQEYYPLPDDLSTTELVLKVEAIEKKYGKPVLFTEAGFPSAAGANRKPWDDSGGEVNLDLQARAYDAVFRAFYDKPWFAGAYWWKVGSDGRGGPGDTSHSPWGKPAMQVISRYYLADKSR